MPWYVREPPPTFPTLPPEYLVDGAGGPGASAAPTTTTTPSQQTTPTTTPGAVTVPAFETTTTTMPAPFRCSVAVRAVPPFASGVYEADVYGASAVSAWVVTITSSGQRSVGLRLVEGQGSLRISSPAQAPVVLVYASYETRPDQLGCRTPE